MAPGEAALRKALDRTLTEAAARMTAGKPVDASRSYARAARFAEEVVEVLEVGGNSGEAEAMRLRAIEYRSRAAALSKGREDDKRCRPFPEADADDRGYSDSESDAIDQQILMLIDDGGARLDWNRIGGLDPVGRELKFHYGLALARHPEGVELEGWNNVMLYGPPGNGKTLLACAVARNLGATFFNVKASQIVSKWVGESGRLIAALYRLARKYSRTGTPSIVFIDEFDALCQDRSSGTQLHHRQMLASILSELDGFAHKVAGSESGRVLTLGATNRPWDLDAAALSRFERRMHIPLPDAEARERIFEIHLGLKGIPLRAEAGEAGPSGLYAELASRGEGMSGREIARLCKDAVSRMLSESNAEIPGLVDSGAEAVRAHTLRMRPLELSDFLPWFAQAKAETSAADAERYRLWGSV